MVLTSLVDLVFWRENGAVYWVFMVTIGLPTARRRCNE